MRAWWRGLAVLLLGSALTLWHLWPLPLYWRTHLQGGNFEDSWMNAWHIDWMRHCVSAGQNPFFAPGLHHPLGAELVWHTMAPAKSLLGALFSLYLEDSIASLNLVIVSSFVLTALTSYLLCAYFVRDLPARRRTLSALIGMCVFTFSRYHLAHAIAHMNLTAIEGMPLFLLAFLRHSEAHERGERARGWLVCAGFAAGYTALCDFYYVYYLYLFTGAWYAVRTWQRGQELLRGRALRSALTVWGVGLLGALPAIVPLLLHLSPQPIAHHHDDSDYPADLLTPFYPDRLSMWNAWIPQAPRDALNRMQKSLLNDAEGGCFVGVAAPALAWIGVRGSPPKSPARALGVLAIVFYVLSLGVFLNLGGNEPQPAWVALLLLCGVVLLLLRPSSALRQDLRRALVLVMLVAPLLTLTAYGEVLRVRIPMPFLLFKHLVPLFGRGGMPVRLLLLTQLCLALLATRGTAQVLARSARFAPLVAMVLLALVNLETKSVPFTMVPVPPSSPAFDMIRDDPEPIAVFTDHVIGQWEQRAHHRPVSFARQSRLPVREAGLLTHPLQRYLVDHHTMGRIAGDSEVVAMREALRAGNFRYFVAHSATVYASDTPAPIAVQRDRLVREQLGGVLVYADADRQIYRFW